MLKIDILSDSALIDQHSLEPGSYRLGKSDLCDIRLMDSHVSRHHANLVVSERGAYISDAGSTNGTWKDSKRITRYGALKTGDSFQIGNLTLKVAYASNSEEVASNGIDTPAGHADDVHPNETRTDPPGISDSALVTADGTEGVVPPDAGFEQTSKMRAQDPTALRPPELEARDNAVTSRPDEESPEAGSQDGQERQSGVEDIVEFEAHPPEAEEGGVVEEELSGMEPAPVNEPLQLPEEASRGDRNLIKFLLKEANVTEVMINGPELVYVERNGIIEPVNTRFESAESLMRAVLQLLPSRLRKFPVDPPIVNTRLVNGARINAIFPPLSRVGPVVTIRKSARQRFTIEDMVVAGILSREMVEFLSLCVRERRNIFVSGMHSSGRTTMLEVLANIIPASERILSIEEQRELRLHQDHVIALESQPRNQIGEKPVSTRELVANAQHMRPERMVLGECRGAEAFDLLQAVNGGASGVLTTTYGSSPDDALSRLEMMTRLSGYDLPITAVRELIVSAVDVIVQVKRYDDGRRRVDKIVEVDSLDDNGFSVQPIFEFRIDRARSNGAISGMHSGCDYSPSFYQDLEAGGVKLNRSIFASSALGTTHH